MYRRELEPEIKGSNEQVEFYNLSTCSSLFLELIVFAIKLLIKEINLNSIREESISYIVSLKIQFIAIIFVVISNNTAA